MTDESRNGVVIAISGKHRSQDGHPPVPSVTRPDRPVEFTDAAAELLEALKTARYSAVALLASGQLSSYVAAQVQVLVNHLTVGIGTASQVAGGETREGSRS